MYTFKDFYQNVVKLSFENEPFSKTPKHVLVICQYKGQWLLTEHSERGLEFPGGKVELGETAQESAIREVYEETGGSVDIIEYIAQYVVDGRTEKVFKNVYFATISQLKDQSTYYETLGPVLCEDLPANIRKDKRFSFIMKDDIVPKCLGYITERNK